MSAPTDRYYVLWHNQAGLPVWDGPYETFEATASSTARRDRRSDAFVTMIQGDEAEHE